MYYIYLTYIHHNTREHILIMSFSGRHRVATPASQVQILSEPSDPNHWRAFLYKFLANHHGLKGFRSKLLVSLKGLNPGEPKRIKPCRAFSSKSLASLQGAKPCRANIRRILTMPYTEPFLYAPVLHHVFWMSHADHKITFRTIIRHNIRTMHGYI